MASLNVHAAKAPKSIVKIPIKSSSQKVCDALQEKLDEDCAHLMCDDGIANGTYANIDECTGDEDYAEAAQGGCDGQPGIEDAAREYNKSHPGAKLVCE